MKVSQAGTLWLLLVAFLALGRVGAQEYGTADGNADIYSGRDKDTDADLLLVDHAVDESTFDSWADEAVHDVDATHGGHVAAHNLLPDVPSDDGDEHEEIVVANDHHVGGEDVTFLANGKGFRKRWFGRGKGWRPRPPPPPPPPPPAWRVPRSANWRAAENAAMHQRRNEQSNADRNYRDARRQHDDDWRRAQRAQRRHARAQWRKQSDHWRRIQAAQDRANRAALDGHDRRNRARMSEWDKRAAALARRHRQQKERYASQTLRRARDWDRYRRAHDRRKRALEANHSSKRYSLLRRIEAAKKRRAIALRKLRPEMYDNYNKRMAYFKRAQARRAAFKKRMAMLKHRVAMRRKLRADREIARLRDQMRKGKAAYALKQKKKYAKFLKDENENLDDIVKTKLDPAGDLAGARAKAKAARREQRNYEALQKQVKEQKKRDEQERQDRLRRAREKEFDREEEAHLKRLAKQDVKVTHNNMIIHRTKPDLKWGKLIAAVAAETTKVLQDYANGENNPARGPAPEVEEVKEISDKDSDFDEYNPTSWNN